MEFPFQNGFPLIQRFRNRGSSAETTLFRINLGDNRLAASTSIDGLPGLLRRDPPGLYVIEELTIPPGLLSIPSSRRWGYAIKHEDGRVELRSDDDVA